MISPMVKNLTDLVFFYYFLFFLMFIFERDRVQTGEGQRERGRHRIRSRLQALSCQHRARQGTRTHRLRDHDLSRSWRLHWLTHPGFPMYKFLCRPMFPFLLCRPSVELLHHWVTPCFMFWAPVRLFSPTPALFFVCTSNVWGVRFPHISANTYS